MLNKRIVNFALSTGAGLIVLCGSANAEVRYTITDLGVLPDGTHSIAHCINQQGDIAGQSDRNANNYEQATLWTDGELLDLTGMGISGASAFAVNDNGVVVGYTDEFEINAFVWEDGVITSLPQFHDGGASSAYDINNNGLIVGEAPPDSGGYNVAVYWQNGEIFNLGFHGTAFGVNDAGQITGHMYVNNDFRAFFWDAGTLINIGTLGGEDSFAKDINESGKIVGYADTSNGRSHAFLWDGETMIDLGTLGSFFSYAYAINDNDHIVGSSYGDFTGIHATLWLDPASPLDLNDLIDPAEGWTLYYAYDINNAGQIVGNGLHNGQQRAFLLTPIVTGDLDHDGDVDQADLGILLSSYGNDAGGDLDGDGDTDQADLGILLANYGYGT
ncbi:MAG TPA: DUF3466 family protein [Phycisphaeraceae bacterium]|nr:DUF3466 family protein [Phycisphaeraceae bacterium]